MRGKSRLRPIEAHPFAPQLEAFEKQASRYGDYYGTLRSGRTFSFAKRRELACEMAGPFHGTLLDCGCGTGEITSAILQSGRFSRATVVDLSTSMLEHARRRLQSHGARIALDLVRGNIFAYCRTHSASRYDLILCLGLIAHTGRLRDLLRLLRSRLNPHGAILLQSSLTEHAGNRIVRMVSERWHSKRFGYRRSYYGRPDIEGAALSAGLRIADCRRYAVGIPFGDRISPLANWWAERFLERWARNHGGEALFLLTS